MESWVHLNKIIYLPGNGVKNLELEFSDACSVSENLTLLKWYSVSMYTCTYLSTSGYEISMY